jgi:hypothetical protein
MSDREHVDELVAQISQLQTQLQAKRSELVTTLMAANDMTPLERLQIRVSASVAPLDISHEDVNAVLRRIVRG